MWARRENFPPYFLSFLFSLLNQTVKNAIFLPYFSLPIFLSPCFQLNQTYLGFTEKKKKKIL